MSNDQYIERGAQVAERARARLQSTHPGMTDEQLDDAVQAAELAYLTAVRDVFNEIALLTQVQAGPNGAN